MINSKETTNISVKPDKTRLQNLLDEVVSGSIKIPVFQRDFVWKPTQMIELFDSILKGYPIGSLLLWFPEDDFKTKEFIGPYKIDIRGSNINYVLDGFQRISTLFGVLMNPNKLGYESIKELKDYNIHYDLFEKEFTYLRKKKDVKPYYIPLYKAFDTFEFLDFLRQIESEFDFIESKLLIDNAKELSKILYDYEIPYVQIKGGDIKSAVQIFSRINSKGTEISQDFMLSALSYNQETNFLFSDAITEFINSLNVYNFEKLKRDTVLNCIANTKGKVYFDVKMEELLKPDLEPLTRKAFTHIYKAVKFLHQELLILDVRLLPYPTQLIFISEFFRINPEPSYSQIVSLINWFWFTTYSNYFTIYSLSQQRLSYRLFLEFAKGQNEDGILRLSYDDKFSAAKFPDKLNFTGVRTKALQLFMLKYRDSHLYDYPRQGETIKEMFIFNQKDRTPANIIILTGEEFEQDFLTQSMEHFLNNTNIEVLSSYFINEELIQLFNENNIEKFILTRETLIREQESEFVLNLGIHYFDDEF